ncbi:cytochrome c biogenesis protein DipZ [Granulicella mallensis]|uniref:Cytochrome c biogenesis protein transmembrane region n=1 Tax=Granulicella mallensis (strain ATCC BAA-1857 / DSM 23137 / MP5ACTX8) TaxID=682795 RepID=G8NPN1_GRAMM|nr:cytochrome c biogenesis protein DipZ [Granulicella mallensis]AEU36043.1 cytochrome c biogenesis protein transmembrane region [Granulicella mallensis MP5ACTX8]
MLLLLLAYFGGILTILSPCILPVLPFVFARSDQPFRKSGLPLLAGMVVTFALIASLATVGGGWAIRANQFGRAAALVLFGIFGLTLLFSSLAERLSRPFVRLGNSLSQTSGEGPSVANSFLLGIGTGLLWAPCAGPILGLILTGAALGGASAHTTVLLLAYAAGAATSLTLALLAGGRVFSAMKRSLGAEEWIRRILGVAVLAGVVAVAFGLDRGVLTRLSLASTSGLEQRLVDRFHPQNDQMMARNPQGTPVSSEMTGDALSQINGATAWINSPPLTPESLRGKVVLVDFWTYSCINCIRSLPYIKAWYAKYKDDGLVVIGVHTPEFPFEKDEANVQKAVRDLGVLYPVAMDNDYRIWRNFNNQYWPAHYFIDATGHVRYHHFGEGNYDESEKWIRGLLEEANHKPLPDAATQVAATGAEAAASDDTQSPETYIGYERAQNFASPDGFNQDDVQLYRVPAKLQKNQWALEGNWLDEGQIATSLAPAGSILYRFHARDLHLVLGPAKDGKPIRFRVTLDGKAPGADHGVDTDAEGYGTVTDNRLYQLIRQQGAIQDRTFRIEFLVPGVQAYAFTFG